MTLIFENMQVLGKSGISKGLIFKCIKYSHRGLIYNHREMTTKFSLSVLYSTSTLKAFHSGMFQTALQPYRLCPVMVLTSSRNLKSSATRRSESQSKSVEPSSGRQKLVILGTGWGSYSVLKNISKDLFDVIVVSPRNHFLFTPLLSGTTVGTLEFRSIIEPVRNSGFRQSDHFHLSYARKLDMESQTLTLESALKPGNKYNLYYDQLVIGVGALSSTFNVPGVTENAFFLKEIADARRIRDRILNNFELSIQPNTDDMESKRLLHFIIVGGGPTGVEFGAELYDFVEQDVTRLYKKKRNEVKVTLIESNKILGAFDEGLRNYAEKKIKERAGFNLVQSTVTEVKDDHVVLSSGEKVPCGLVVWSTGLAPRPFVRDLDVTKNKHGQILTNKFLQVLDNSKKNVFALGDCADIEEMPLPCTAQVAEREGRYLAKQLNKPAQEREEFKFTSMGMLAYIGKYEGLTDIPHVKLQGFTSWLVWRSAYLTRLGSFRLRMQVPLDWTKTLLFGRDISRLE